MTPSTTNQYVVWLTSWSSLKVIVTAVNEQHAKALAEKLWATDDSAFNVKDGGIDAVDAYRIDEEAGS